MKMLIPLDGSRAAEAALRKALELASGGDTASIALVRAVEPAALPGRFGAAQVRAIDEAAAYLRGVAARLRRAGVERIDRSVSYAPAAHAIVEAARGAKPDLVVMASRGSDRLTAGPVVQFVLQAARLPIVLVAAGDRATRCPDVRAA